MASGGQGEGGGGRDDQCEAREGGRCEVDAGGSRPPAVMPAPPTPATVSTASPIATVAAAWLGSAAPRSPTSSISAAAATTRTVSER